MIDSLGATLLWVDFACLPGSLPGLALDGLFPVDGASWAAVAERVVDRVAASPRDVLYALDLFGTVVFAVSGALAAGRRHMDLFGVLVIAAVTAVGGGTTRDLLLDRHPVFWIDDGAYLVVIAAAALVTFVYTRYRRPPANALLYADAFGLAVFAVVGARVAADAGADSVIVVLMAGITATVGGMIRDVLCDETPLILRREIYATAALGGGAVYLGLQHAGLGPWTAASITIAAVTLTRLAALHWTLHLPSLRVREKE
jgi:uncharacterized membrane protein YeiH